MHLLQTTDYSAVFISQIASDLLFTNGRTATVLPALNRKKNCMQPARAKHAPKVNKIVRVSKLIQNLIYENFNSDCILSSVSLQCCGAKQWKDFWKRVA